MPESIVGPSSVRAAFEAIVDYAGLFPPAQLSMEAAALEYASCRASAHAWMLGRFVVPAARTAELDALLGEGPTVAASVLFDGETAIRTTRHVTPEACEVRLQLPVREHGAVRTAVRALRKGLEQLAPGLPAAIELPRGLHAAALAEAMDALRDNGFAAKIRCGGVTGEETPRVEEIADFAIAASRAGVAFKATAGLHHPVRAFNAAAGFVMHGFLNVLGAACLASRVDSAAVREIVAEDAAAAFVFTDAGFAWREMAVADVTSLREIRATRFLGFGSCSFYEPIDDLVALSMVSA